MDDGVYMVTSTDPSTGDHTIEMRVVDVSLLSCGCLSALTLATQPERNVSDRSLTDPRPPRMVEMKITTILDTGVITGADMPRIGHTHGGPVTSLDVKAWRLNVNARLPYDTKWGRS